MSRKSETSSTQFVPKAIILTFFTSILSACALTDITPPNGFPPEKAEQKRYIPLVPEAEFEFHQNGGQLG